MKSRLLIIWSFLSGCTLLVETDHKYLPDVAEDSAITLQSRLISADATTAIIEGDIMLIDDYYLYNLTYYSKNEFQVQSSDGATVTLQAADIKQFTLPARKFPAILISEAAAYSLLDPMNNRSKAVSKLLEDIGSASVIIGGFAKGGQVADPVELRKFEANTYADQIPFVFGLAKKTGGTNNLFDALNATIDKLKESKLGGDLVVLTDGSDQTSSAGLPQIISNATTNDVRVHVVYLGNSLPGVHAGLASQTNGSFALCPNYQTMITSLAGIDRWSHLNVTGYRVRVQYKKSSGTFAPGQQISVSVKVKDAYNGYEFNPFMITVKLP